MSRIDRRAFLQAALSVGATAAWGNDFAHASRVAWREQRTMFPEGVASGDPDYRSVQWNMTARSDRIFYPSGSPEW